MLYRLHLIQRMKTEVRLEFRSDLGNMILTGGDELLEYRFNVEYLLLPDITVRPNRDEPCTRS